MKTLRVGSSGADVVALQNALATKGFDPGAVDGVFGPATEAAVIAFQATATLAADGIVDPDRTCALLRGGTQKRRNKLWLLLRLESWYRRWIVDARPEIQASEVYGENALSSMA